MNNCSDAQLLQEFAEHGRQDAFRAPAKMKPK
jgi:hypothetical protein